MKTQRPGNRIVITVAAGHRGRYAKQIEPLRGVFSEFGLMRCRIQVELEWLKALAAEPSITEVAPFSEATIAEINDLIAAKDDKADDKKDDAKPAASEDQLLLREETVDHALECGLNNHCVN